MRGLIYQCLSLLSFCYILNFTLCINPFTPIFLFRAYVVPKVKPQSEEECTVFSKEIQKWVRGQVANHQYLRGGVVIIDQIPKNGAGKVLRRQLRNQGN